MEMLDPPTKGAPVRRKCVAALFSPTRCGPLALRIPPVRSQNGYAAKPRGRRNVFQYFRSEYQWEKNRGMSPHGLESELRTLRANRKRCREVCQNSASNEVAQNLFRACSFRCVFVVGNGACLMSELQAEKLIFQIFEAGGYRSVHIFHGRRGTVAWRIGRGSFLRVGPRIWLRGLIRRILGRCNGDRNGLASQQNCAQGEDADEAGH